MSSYPNVQQTDIQDSRDDASYESIDELKRREALWAYAFIAPTFIGFVLFIAGPMVWAMGLSLFQYNIFQPPEFVGLANYSKMLSDGRVLVGFQNTLMFTVAVVLLDVIVALALAVALQQSMPFILRSLFRTIFILPVVTSLAATAIIMKFILSTNLGVINYYLGQLGFDKIPWLDSTKWALWALILTTVWKTFGFDLLLLSAGIQNIPRQLYEAAEIDGANVWQKFIFVTLPQLSSSIFFVVVVGVIGHLQMFDQARIMTAGGPGESTTTVVMVIWDKLSQVQYGYGSSIAVVFFLFILLLTVIQFWFSRRWVYYEGAEDAS